MIAPPTHMGGCPLSGGDDGLPQARKVRDINRKRRESGDTMLRNAQSNKSGAGARLLLGAALLAGLAACSDNDGSGPGSGAPPGPAMAAVNGVAAFGAPVVGGTVSARCADGSGFSDAVTTGAQGAYSGEVLAAALPCALRVSGGNLPASYGALHSFATRPGRVNITALTDLAVALAVNNAAGQTLAQWFANPSQLPQVGGALATALTALRNALVIAGYQVPAGWTAANSAPFSDAFTPNPASDPYDALLEQLAEAVQGSATLEDYQDLLAAFIGGGALPEAPEPEPADTQPATVNASLAKGYNLVFSQTGGLGCGSSCSFTEGQEVTATVGSNNTLTIAGKTLANPFNQRVGEQFNLAEIIWLDGPLAYALSNNQNGVFNEINVGRVRSGGGFDFLGQLTEDEGEEPPPPPPALDAIKALAGTYDFDAAAVLTGVADLGQPRGLRSDDGYPVCEPLGIEAGDENPFSSPDLWLAQVVIADSGAVTVRSTINPAQAITLTPGVVSADDFTAANPGTTNLWLSKNPDGKLYSLRRTVRYEDGVHPGKLSESFEFLLGVTAGGRLENVEMRGSAGSPRMAFCPATLERRAEDPLAPLKALAGSYGVKRNYVGGTVPWSNLSIGSDGAIGFDGSGPSFAVTEIRKFIISRRNDNNNSTDDSVWALSVYLNRDLNGDSTIDKKDVINLFLTEAGGLRDVQHLTASNSLVEVSVVDRALPAYDESLAALLSGNGVSGRIGSTAQLVSSTQTFTRIEIASAGRMDLFAGRNRFPEVPEAERKAWRITANFVPLETNTAYACNNGNPGVVQQETAVLFDDGFGVLTSANSGSPVQPAFSSRLGGDCEITLTSVTRNGSGILTAVEGRYRAVLWHGVTKRYQNAAGHFRFTPPPP